MSSTVYICMYVCVCVCVIDELVNGWVLMCCCDDGGCVDVLHCVCIYVCMYGCMYVCMYVCVVAHVCH